MIQHFYHSLRCTRCKTCLITFKYLCRIDGIHTVCVLLMAYDIFDCTFIYMPGQRSENQYSMHGSIIIHLPDFLGKSLLGDRFRVFTNPAAYPKSFTPFYGSPLVRKVIRPCSNPYNSKTGYNPFFTQLLYILR